MSAITPNTTFSGITGDPMANAALAAKFPLFAGLNANQPFATTTPTLLTGFSLAVEVGWYEAELRIASDALSDDTGEITTGGTGVFSAELAATVLSPTGAGTNNTFRPPTFTTVGLGTAVVNIEEILVITGRIKVTTAGTITILANGFNAGGLVFIAKALSSFTLTKLN